MGFRVTTSGSFANNRRFLQNARKLQLSQILNAAGQEGVAALAVATPKDSGLAASLWRYEVSSSFGGTTLTWYNSDVENGFPVAVMLQYGHGTRGGGYVQGRDYINPAMRAVFDRISDEVWKAVTEL